MSTNKLVNEKGSKLVRIDAGVHKLAKVEAAKSGETLRSLVEGGLAYILGVDHKGD